jgi:2-phosphosulfolactate phosphatase
MKVPCIHIDWSTDGLEFALKGNDIVVIVDALRFSSAVVTAVAHGFTIYPVTDEHKGRALAASVGAVMAGKSGKARYSLSPRSFLNRSRTQTSVVLYSPNGATCASYIQRDGTACIGCFLNARAVAHYVRTYAEKTGRNVTVLACGEQRAYVSGERIVYRQENGQRVFAAEDYLACGAIISASDMEKTAEAIICEAAFTATRDRLLELLLDCFSGQYLKGNGLAADVEYAAQIDRYDTVPVVSEGKIIAAHATT